MKRAMQNCPFYPSCFWAGDCDEGNWKTADCGLPLAEQRKLFEARQSDLRLRIARNALGQNLVRITVALRMSGSMTISKEHGTE